MQICNGAPSTELLQSVKRLRACNGPGPGGGPGLIKEPSRASGWRAAEAEVAGVGKEEQRTTASASGHRYRRCMCTSPSPRPWAEVGPAACTCARDVLASSSWTHSGVWPGSVRFVGRDYCMHACPIAHHFKASVRSIHHACMHGGVNAACSRTLTVHMYISLVKRLLVTVAHMYCQLCTCR